MPTVFAVIELVDGLRFRLFALYNHDIREYELVSKFTVSRAVCAMVSASQKPACTSELLRQGEHELMNRCAGTSYCELRS